MSRISRPPLYRLWSAPSLSTYSASLSNRPETPVDLMTIERAQWHTHDRIFLAPYQPSDVSGAVGSVTYE